MNFSSIHAQSDDETFNTAVFLLQSCSQIDREGRHIALIRALRHIGDPELKPLFASLVQSPYTLFKVHGIMGLADCSPDKQLDLVRIAAIDSPSQQAQVVSEAMDAKMLSDDQAQQIYNWPGIDNSIQLVVATQLIRTGLLKNTDPIKESIKSDNPARKYLALLLLAQLGDDQALSQLTGLHQIEHKKRDDVRYMLLGTSMQFDFHAIGPWAMSMASEAGINRGLSMRALKTSLRFNVPGAVDIWRAQFRSSTDMAHLMRLALVAFQLAPWVDGQVFDDLASHTNERIRQIGKAGQAVAKKKDIATQAIELIKLNYPPANRGIIAYALHHAESADAVAIYTAFIHAYENGPDRYRTRRLEDAALATQSLYELDPIAAEQVLRPLLVNKETSPLLVQGLLLGLIRCGTPQPHMVIKDIPIFNSDLANQLALLLRARYGQGLDAESLEELSLVVRGGGLRKGALRIQAAWLYLKITNQTASALAAVLGE